MFASHATRNDTKVLVGEKMGELLYPKHPTQAMLSWFTDNELRREDQKYVEDHLEKCAKCTLQVKRIRRVNELFGRSRNR